MFAALCSWTYNLGTGALQRSSLRRLYINEGRYEEAADEMLRWVFCNGRRLRGLVLRRTDERARVRSFELLAQAMDQAAEGELNLPRKAMSA